MAKSNALPIEYIQKEFLDGGAAGEWADSITDYDDTLDRLQSIHIFKTKDGMWHGTACLEKEQK